MVRTKRTSLVDEDDEAYVPPSPRPRIPRGRRTASSTAPPSGPGASSGSRPPLYPPSMDKRGILSNFTLDMSLFRERFPALMLDLSFQKLDTILTLKMPFFIENVYEFYHNLALDRDSDDALRLRSSFNGQSFVYGIDRLRHLLRLDNDGIHESSEELCETLEIDNFNDLKSEIFHPVHNNQSNKAHGLLFRNKLAYHILSHIVLPHSSNFTDVTNEYIFLLGCIHRKVKLDFASLIFFKMDSLKTKSKNGLPYGALISAILNDLNLVPGGTLFKNKDKHIWDTSYLSQMSIKFHNADKTITWSGKRVSGPGYTPLSPEEEEYVGPKATPRASHEDIAISSDSIPPTDLPASSRPSRGRGKAKVGSSNLPPRNEQFYNDLYIDQYRNAQLQRRMFRAMNTSQDDLDEIDRLSAEQRAKFHGYFPNLAGPNDNDDDDEDEDDATSHRD